MARGAPGFGPRRGLVGLIEELSDLIVSDRREVSVPEPHSHEWLGRARAEDLLDLTAEHIAGLARRRRNRHDDRLRAAVTKCPHRRPHRRSGSESIVNHNRQPITHLNGCAVPAIGDFLAPQRLELPRGNGVDLIALDSYSQHDVVVEDHHVTRCDCTHRQLLVAGNAQLADDKHVERSPQGTCHLVGNRDTPARQPQHHDVIAVCVVPQRGCETATGIVSVGEAGFVADAIRVGAGAR